MVQGTPGRLAEAANRIFAFYSLMEFSSRRERLSSGKRAGECPDFGSLCVLAASWANFDFRLS